LANETHKKCIKSQYEKSVCPYVFSKGDLVFVYEFYHDTLGVGKFEPIWHGPYIVKRVLKRGAYELVDYDGNPLSEPHNGLYLKKYYSYAIWLHDALYIGVFLFGFRVVCFYFCMYISCLNYLLIMIYA